MWWSRWQFCVEQINIWFFGLGIAFFWTGKLYLPHEAQISVVHWLLIWTCSDNFFFEKMGHFSHYVQQAQVFSEPAFFRGCLQVSGVMGLLCLAQAHLINKFVPTTVIFIRLSFFFKFFFVCGDICLHPPTPTPPPQIVWQISVEDACSHCS